MISMHPTGHPDEAYARQSSLRPPSDYIDSYLSGGAAESFTVPVEAKILIFSAKDHFWVNFTGTAVEPVASVIDGSSSSLSPAGYFVEPGQVISIIADVGVHVNLIYYKK